MPKAIATITTNAPKSGSQQQQRRRSTTMTREQRQEAAEQRLLQRLLGVQERRLAHGVARRVEHDGELHELRRLQVDRRRATASGASRSPTCRCRGRARARAARAPAMKSHGASRCHACIGTWNATSAATSADARRTSRGARGSTRRGSRCAPSLGHRDRRRVHHHQADREQQQRRPRERRVVGEHRADCAAARLGASLASSAERLRARRAPYAWASSARRARTRAAKRSPRST